VIGLTRITKSATEEKVQAFIEEKKVEYPMAKEDGSVSRYFNVSGIPAAAVIKDGKVVCFFQSGAKFGARYATLGFSDTANLDEGAMWPTAFALKELTAAEEARISALVKKAVS